MVLALGAPVLFATLNAWNTAQLGKDPVRNFAYLHSIVFDRDFDFHNEFLETYPRYVPGVWAVDELEAGPEQLDKLRSLGYIQ